MSKSHPFTARALATRWLCAYRGWSRRMLARRSKIGEVTLYRYEHGKVTPSLESLERLRAAVAFPLPVEELLAWCRLALREGVLPPANVASNETAWQPADLPRLAVGQILRALLPEEEPPPPSPADREAVPMLWGRLAGASGKVRRALVEKSTELHQWALAEHLCAESRKASARCAEEALELADLARRIACRLRGDSLHRLQVAGFAEAHVGNALRVGGSQAQALEAFVRAKDLWTAGASAEPGLLDEAQFLSLEVSLRRDRRELSAALTLVDQALAIDRGTLAPDLLIQKAGIRELLGEYDGAVSALREAAALLGERPDPRLLWLQRFGLMVNLCHLGRAGEAETLLPEVLSLAAERGAELDHLRLGWLRARIAAGLGRREEAAGRLDEVRQAFARLGIAFDTALASVELAVVYLEDGRTAEAKVLAHQMMPIFRAQGVPAEALKALRLFTEAVRREAADAGLARRLIAYLYRSQGDPQLRFEA